MKMKAKGKLQDRINDKFYTNYNVVSDVLKMIDFEKYDFIIEPSAGSGAFTKKLPEGKTLSMDIHPEGENIKKSDWFEYHLPKKYNSVLIVGNPPFGKNNNLSLKFIEHATSFKNVKTIAFILPNVYKKHTLQKYISKDFKLIKIKKLPKNSFSLSGELHHVPCSFFIFERESTEKDLRQNPNKRSRDFKFSTKNDFDFFIFGAAPKKITLEPKENNRGYYIKSIINKEVLKNRFREIDWKGHSSANGGIYWLTKVDIVENYNRQKRKNAWKKK